MDKLLASYANLLVHYCLELQPDERLYVSTTTLAEPLVREVWREALRVGAIVETDLSFREKNRIQYQEAGTAHLRHAPLLYRHAMESFDAYLHILAPFNLREDQDADTEKTALRQAALQPYHRLYSERTADRSMKRNLCQFPTAANAQEAGMSLEAYESFVYKACLLHMPDPAAAWRAVRQEQQRIVDYLNTTSHIRYLGKDIDISFSTQGRTWINSDGRTNMPSGEVYTSPVEDSVNGVIHFGYPTIFSGAELEGITLHVENGTITRWDARKGKSTLDRVFDIPGTRHFGEAAIGTNYNIDRFTKNILFDEKIGGTVHMAVGQSYLQAGGRNQSAVHWDMIADMTDGGMVFADGQKIYENGRFLL
ncbi:MAG: hypothetical protein RLY31_853 [Bacteroidota bacterium]|jgi:aminopeptidase